MRLYSLLLTLIAFASACTSAPKDQGQKTTLPEALGALGLSTTFSNGYQVSENSQDEQSGMLIKNLVAKTREGRVLRVQELQGGDSNRADAFIQGKLFQLRSIYEPHRDPYFAALTKDTVCPDKYRLTSRKSVKTANFRAEILSLYSNDRLTYGACTEEQAAFRTFVALLECGNGKDLYVLESFVPIHLVSDLDATIMDTVHCQ